MTPPSTTVEERRRQRDEREQRMRGAAEQRAAGLTTSPDEVAAQVTAAVAQNATSDVAAIRWIALSDIIDSPNQTRHDAIAEEELDGLAESIRKIGLLAFPLARPASGRPGTFELIAGHQRIAALRLLAESPNAPLASTTFIRRSPRGPAVPVIVRDIDDLGAFQRTIAENDKRHDLSPWERCLTYRRYQLQMKAEGRPASVEDVGAELCIPKPTLAPYLRVSERLSDDVLTLAGLPEGRARHAPLTDLSLAHLRRIAGFASLAARSEVLRQALGKAAQASTTIEDQQEADASRRPSPPTSQVKGEPPTAFQINIRGPVGSVRPAQAAKYAMKMTPVLCTLIEQCTEYLADSEASMLLTILDAATASIRARRHFSRAES